MSAGPSPSGRTLPLSYSEAERLLVAGADARNGNFMKYLIDRLLSARLQSFK